MFLREMCQAHSYGNPVHLRKELRSQSEFTKMLPKIRTKRSEIGKLREEFTVYVMNILTKNRRSNLGYHHQIDIKLTLQFEK